MSKSATIWTLGALGAAAFALRLYRLDSGLWLDEIYTWVRFMRLPLSTIPTVYGSENQHFLYSLLAKISMLTFGESVWAFRLPAVLFGVASIGAMYLFGAAVASPKEGLLSAALLTFSYHHVWFSQNARGYTGLLFWTLFGSWLLLRALQDHRLSLWIGYAVVAAIGVYTQATLVFVLMSHAAIALGFAIREKSFRGPLTGFGLGTALTFLLHAPALGEILRGLRGTVSVVTDWKSPGWTISELAAGLSIGFYGSVAAGAVIALFAAGVWSYWKTSRPVVFLLVLPPVIGASLLFAAGHHIWPRFFFFSFGFAALIAIRGALVVPRVGHALALTLIALSAASVPLAYGPKQDFGAAYDYVRLHRKSGDAVVTADLATWVYSRFYHAGWTAVESPDDLESIRKAAPRTWLVYTLEPVFRSQTPELHALVRRDFKIAQTFPGTLRNGEVVVCLYEHGGSL